jgi:hypothetical protein
MVLKISIIIITTIIISMKILRHLYIFLILFYILDKSMGNP